MSVPDDTPVAQARVWLVSRLWDPEADRPTRGTTCPVCVRHAQVYRRALNSGMARSLIAMYRHGGKEFIHIPTAVPQRSREDAKMRYWGLVEEERVLRPDGGRAGYWRVTDQGERFVLEGLLVPKWAIEYDSDLMGMDSSELTDINAALGDRFRLDELMEGL